nr:acyltransferase [Microbacterium kyungheense]
MSAPTSSRIASLDGLRGTAALIVLLHHALLTMSGFAAVYWGLPAPAFAAPFAYTPLHVVWAGPEAVLVFFVLSGVVLTLPATRRRSLPWAAYYPSRLIRLYLPVLFAVAFAVLLARLWPRATDGRYSPWVQMHNEAPTVANALHNAFLLNGTTWLNSPLWSLQWEVLFSLLLPVYVFLAVRWGRDQWLLIGCGLVALIVAGEVTGIVALRYLPYFGLGSLVAANLEALTGLSDRFDRSRRSTLAQSALAAGALILLTFRWWPGNLLPAPVAQFSGAIVAVGAVLVVLVAVCLPGARRVLASRPLMAAGTISFSLYLVHEPILVTLAVVTPPDMSWIAPLAGIPLAIAAGWLFYIVIERGTHRLARAVARAIKSRPIKPSASSRVGES